MSLEAPVIFLHLLLSGYLCLKVGHLSLAFCFIIGLEAQFLLPQELYLEFETFSLAPIYSTRFLLHGQTATLIHIFIQQNISILYNINITFKISYIVFY